MRIFTPICKKIEVGKKLKGRNFFLKTIIFYNVFKQYAFITTISKKDYSWVSYFFSKIQWIVQWFFFFCFQNGKIDNFFWLFFRYFWVSLFFSKRGRFSTGFAKIISMLHFFFCYLSLQFIKNAIFFHSSIETRVFLNFFVLKNQGKIELGV